MAHGPRPTAPALARGRPCAASTAEAVLDVPSGRGVAGLQGTDGASPGPCPDAAPATLEPTRGARTLPTSLRRAEGPPGGRPRRTGGSPTAVTSLNTAAFARGSDPGTGVRGLVRRARRPASTAAPSAEDVVLRPGPSPRARAASSLGCTTAALRRAIPTRTPARGAGAFGIGGPG